MIHTLLEAQHVLCVLVGGIANDVVQHPLYILTILVVLLPRVVVWSEWWGGEDHPQVDITFWEVDLEGETPKSEHTDTLRGGDRKCCAVEELFVHISSVGSAGGLRQGWVWVWYG